MPANLAQVLARVGAWVLAIVTIITGISFINAVEGVKWSPNGDGTQTGQPYDIVGVGTCLLCVGLLILAALLIVEAYGPKVTERSSTPDA